MTVPSDFTAGSALQVRVTRAGAAVPLRLPPPADDQAQLLIEASGEESAPSWCFVPEGPYRLEGLRSIVRIPDGTPTAIGIFDSHEDGRVERDARNLGFNPGGVEAFVGRAGTQTMIGGGRGRLTGLPPGTYRLTLRRRRGWDGQGRKSVWQRSFTVGRTWSAPVVLLPTDQRE